MSWFFGKAIFLHFTSKSGTAMIYLVLLSCYLALCIVQLSAVRGFLLSQCSHMPLVPQWCSWAVSGEKVYKPGEKTLQAEHRVSLAPAATPAWRDFQERTVKTTEEMALAA